MQHRARARRRQGQNSLPLQGTPVTRDGPRLPLAVCHRHVRRRRRRRLGPLRRLAWPRVRLARRARARAGGPGAGRARRHSPGVQRAAAAAGDQRRAVRVERLRRPGRARVRLGEKSLHLRVPAGHAVPGSRLARLRCASIPAPCSRPHAQGRAAERRPRRGAPRTAIPQRSPQRGGRARGRLRRRRAQPGRRRSARPTRARCRRAPARPAARAARRWPPGPPPRGRRLRAPALFASHGLLALVYLTKFPLPRKGKVKQIV